MPGIRQSRSKPIDPRRRVARPVAVLSSMWLWPRKAWYRSRLKKPSTARVAGLTLSVPPNVMNPKLFRTGAYFAKTLPRLEIVKRQIARSDKRPRLLDMGTGTGILALVGARMGYHATGIDISEQATFCARGNAARNGLSDHTNLLCGDLFEPVGNGKFDLILCSLPKFRGRPRNEFEISWRSPDVIDRFAAGLGDHLAPDGFAVILLTSHGDAEGMLAALEAHGFTPAPVAQKHFGVEIFTIYQVSAPH